MPGHGKDRNDRSFPLGEPTEFRTAGKTGKVTTKPAWQTPTTVAIALLVLAIAGMIAFFVWANAPAGVEIQGVLSDHNDQPVVLTAETCGGELTIEVDETDSEVHIRVTDHRFRIRLSRNDCLDIFEVWLAEPPGDRTLIDGLTNRPIAPG